jgi:Protein of unknown function (DUF3574)
MHELRSTRKEQLMQTTSNRTMWVGRITVLTVGLIMTLALAAITLGPRLEPTPAYAVDPAGKTPLNGDGQQLAGEVFERTELYFGSEKPGPDVTRKQFDRFVDRKVTPRFPDGLTLLTGYGQFRESDGNIVQEKSFVLILLYPPDDKQANREIQELRGAYKRNFEQQSVLRTDSSERVSF